jgi:acyl-CoA thioester hydrolase
MTLEHSRPIHYGDELAITTWVSDFQRVRSHREYLARNAATNEIVARGRAYWAHLNRETLMPTRIPVDFTTLLAIDSVRAVSRTQPRTFLTPHFEFPNYHMTRHVFRYEADEMQHVNNAMYIDWLEEALMECHPERNRSEAELESKDRRLYVYRHDIEYARSAVPGDDVDISVRLVGVGQTASAWKLEIARNGESLVKDRITALWVNNAGKPVRGMR